MNQKVLEYPLLIEPPNSILRGKNAIVWSKITSQVVQTTMAPHLVKDFFGPWSIWNARESTRLWTSIEHQLEDFFWQVSMLSTNDTYDVRQSSKKMSILWSSRSSNTPCSLNSPNLSSNGKMPKSEAKNYVKPSKQRWGLTRWRDVLVRACESRETLERLSTSSGGFLTSFNDLRK